MRVLHVVYNCYPDVSGGAVRTQCLVEAQARLGIHPVVLSAPFQPPADPSRSDGVERYHGIPYHRCYDGSDPARFMACDKPWWERAARLRRLVPFARRIERVALEERVDLIHAHSLAFCGLAASVAGRRLGLPVVYEVRSLIEEGMTGSGRLARTAYRLLDGPALRLASHVVVICEGLRQEMIRRGVAASKITVAGNGVDLEAHAPSPENGRRRADEFVLGYIGTLAPYEGLDLLLEAAALLAARRPRLRVLVVGDGIARPALEEQVRYLRLEAVVRFAGRVPHDEVARCYSRIDLFVLPRRPSRLADLVTPLKPLEIMAHGQPLLASDCGGHRELIVDGVNGVLFQPWSVGALARRIEAMMDDPEGLARLGRQARQWVSENRSWESQCRPVTELYGRLIAARRAARPGVLLVAPAPGGVLTGGVENGANMILRSRLAERHAMRLWKRTSPSRPGRSWHSRLARQILHFTRFAAGVALERPGAVHIKSSSGVNFAQSAVYALIGRLLGRRVLLQLHSGEFPQWYAGQGRLGRWAIRQALRWPSEILVLSEYWRRALCELAPGRLIRVVPNGVEIPEAPARPRSSDGVLRVLTIATLGEHKGHFDILAAADRLRGSPIRFLLAGPDETSGRGQGERIRQRAAELNLAGSVEFVGPVGPSEKWKLLAGSDVFLLPSRAEGMPNAVLEAMAAGLPVVATAVGALPEMLGKGHEVVGLAAGKLTAVGDLPEMLGEGLGGQLVAAGDPDGVAAALLELLQDPARRERMGRWNRVRAEACYSFDRLAQLLDGVYAPQPLAPVRQYGWLKPALLFLLVGELAARIVVPAPPQWLWPQTRFQASPSLGFCLRPSQQSFTADQPFRTNSVGMRGDEVALPKPPGLQRVLVLGDSIASGYGVREEETFARRLEALLNGGGRFEVINAGVPSYNTAQEVEFLAERGFALEPDIVVLALYWNDIHDKEGVGVDAEGRLVDTKVPRPPAFWASPAVYRLRNLMKRSRLLYLALDRCRMLEMRIRPPAQLETQKAVLEGADNPRVEQGWRAVEANLARFADLCRARRIRPLVLIVPMPQQLDRSFPRVRYQTVVQEMCGRQGLDWLDPLPAFQKAYAGHTSLFLPYDGDHPNARGHGSIAEQLFAALKPKEDP